jgi:hypothetical protein
MQDTKERVCLRGLFCPPWSRQPGQVCPKQSHIMIWRNNASFFVEEIVGQQVKVKLAGHEYRKKFWEKNDQGRSSDEVWPIGNKGH